jgi:hypothetical protein
MKSLRKNLALKKTPQSASELLAQIEEQGLGAYFPINHGADSYLEHTQLAIHIFRVLGKNKTNELLKQIATNRKALTNDRSMAIWILSQFAAHRSREVLCSVFKKETDRGLVWEAAKGLISLRRNFPEKIVMNALKSNHAIHREAAAYILGFRAKRKFEMHLLAMLKDCKELVRIRAQAAESLGMLNSKRAVPELIRNLGSRSVELRFWAAFALGHIGAEKALPYLHRLAKTDKRKLKGWWSVAKEARDAITAIKQQSTH